MFHVAYFTDGGINVIDMWESPAKFDTFMNERLGPGIQQVGVMGEPQISWYDAHAVYNPAAERAGVASSAGSDSSTQTASSPQRTSSVSPSRSRTSGPGARASRLLDAGSEQPPRRAVELGACPAAPADLEAPRAHPAVQLVGGPRPVELAVLVLEEAGVARLGVRCWASPGSPAPTRFKRRRAARA